MQQRTVIKGNAHSMTLQARNSLISVILSHVKICFSHTLCCIAQLWRQHNENTKVSRLIKGR